VMSWRAKTALPAPMKVTLGMHVVEHAEPTDVPRWRAL